MKIVAFDPGGTTGIACGDLDEERGLMKVSAEQEVLNHNGLWNYMWTERPDWIITESFEYRNRARPGLELISCELIGVIELYIQQYKSGYVKQTAAKGKGYFTDKILKRDGLYVPGIPHGMDALRHLLHWYMFGTGFQFNKEGYVKA